MAAKKAVNESEGRLAQSEQTTKFGEVETMSMQTPDFSCSPAVTAYDMYETGPVTWSGHAPPAVMFVQKSSALQELSGAS